MRTASHAASGMRPGLEQARADQRLRIDVGEPKRPIVVRQHAHQLARLELRQRRLPRVDLIAEYPQMSGVQAAIFVAFQAQGRQLRG